MRSIFSLSFLIAICAFCRGAEDPAPADPPAGTPPCTDGKVWWNGEPKCGEKYCDNLLRSQQTNVTLCLFTDPKRAGCYCPPDYYINNDKSNACSTRDNCNFSAFYEAIGYIKLCGDNERFDCPCSEKTCSDQSSPSCNSTLETTVIWRDNSTCNETEQKCVCNPGFSRDSAGKCVTECPPPCSVNETWYAQGGVCEKTCLYPQGGNYCDQNTTSICVCSTGFVRDPTTNECVQKSTCDEPDCPRKEVYTECDASVQRTCEDNSFKRPIVTPTLCETGCVCKSGYVRRPDGRCIRARRCPIPTCGVNEVFRACGKTLACQASCKNIDIPVTCTAACTPNCQCRAGFYRDDNNKCVSVSNCKKCSANEVFKCSCGDRKCTNTRAPRCAKCKHNCYCKLGFYRNSKNACVRKRNC